VAPDWFREAYRLYTSRLENYGKDYEECAEGFWEVIQDKTYMRDKQHVSERWPWIPDDNAHTPAHRTCLWANRAVLFTQDEQAAILKKFPELE
jgi:hypothetical protein